MQKVDSCVLPKVQGLTKIVPSGKVWLKPKKKTSRKEHIYSKFHYRFSKGNIDYRAVGECNIHFVFWILITLHDTSTLYIMDNLNLYIESDVHLNFIWKLIYFVYLAEPNTHIMIKEDNIGRDLGGTCIYMVVGEMQIISPNKNKTFNLRWDKWCKVNPSPDESTTAFECYPLLVHLNRGLCIVCCNTLYAFSLVYKIFTLFMMIYMYTWKLMYMYLITLE